MEEYGIWNQFVWENLVPCGREFLIRKESDLWKFLSVEGFWGQDDILKNQIYILVYPHHLSWEFGKVIKLYPWIFYGIKV